MLERSIVYDFVSRRGRTEPYANSTLPGIHRRCGKNRQSGSASCNCDRVKFHGGSPFGSKLFCASRCQFACQTNGLFLPLLCGDDVRSVYSARHIAYPAVDTPLQSRTFSAQWCRSVVVCMSWNFYIRQHILTGPPHDTLEHLSPGVPGRGAFLRSDTVCSRNDTVATQVDHHAESFADNPACALPDLACIVQHRRHPGTRHSEDHRTWPLQTFPQRATGWRIAHRPTLVAVQQDALLSGVRYSPSPPQRRERLGCAPGKFLLDGRPRQRHDAVHKDGCDARLLKRLSVPPLAGSENPDRGWQGSVSNK